MTEWTEKVSTKILLPKLIWSTRRFQVIGIPRWSGHCLTVIYSNIIPLNTKLFTKYLRRHPSKHIRTKDHLKSFPDASKSHKRSTNLSDRAYFRQFSDWYERHFGHSRESSGMLIPVLDKIMYHSIRMEKFTWRPTILICMLRHWPCILHKLLSVPSLNQQHSPSDFWDQGR